jgi:hypothetical protein
MPTSTDALVHGDYGRTSHHNFPAFGSKGQQVFERIEVWIVRFNMVTLGFCGSKYILYQKM